MNSLSTVVSRGYASFVEAQAGFWPLARKNLAVLAMPGEISHFPEPDSWLV